MMNKDGNAREYSERLTALLCDKTVNHEVSGDFTIPDYLPELRKLLSVSERVLPPAKYVSSSGVECNGSIDYKILYVGADGGLYSADLSTEYELKTPIENGGSELTAGTAVTVSTVSEGMNTRITAPRRVNIKNRLCSRIKAYGQADTGGEPYGDSEDGRLQKLYAETEFSSIYPLSSDPIELEEEIGGLFEDSRVISADAVIFANDIRRSSEGLDVSGDVVLKLLACRDTGKAEAITKKLPFRGTLECDEPMSDALYSLWGSVTDINVDVGEGKALCKLSMILSATCVRNAVGRYVADVYSTERECECEKDTLPLPICLSCSVGNFSQSERLTLSETGLPEGATVIDTIGDVIFDGCESLGGRYAFSGKSKYTVLWEKDGEYGAIDVELPLRYEVEGTAAESFSFDACGDVISCRARADGDTLSLDAEIAVATDVFGQNRATVVNGVRFGDPHKKRKSRMVVYYPAAGESLWDVAKKYHVPSDSLSEEKNYYLF